jgi:hypothetical protein
MVTVPLVAGSNPLSMRMRVDLPEPDRPMTTKISPVRTEKLASMTAAVPMGVTSSRVAPCSSRVTTSAALRPNALYTCSALTAMESVTVSWQTSPRPGATVVWGLRSGLLTVATHHPHRTFQRGSITEQPCLPVTPADEPYVASSCPSRAKTRGLSVVRRRSRQTHCGLAKEQRAASTIAPLAIVNESRSRGACCLLRQRSLTLVECAPCPLASRWRRARHRG